MHSRNPTPQPSKILSLVVLPLACIALAMAIAFGNGRPAVAEETTDRAGASVADPSQPSRSTEPASLMVTLTVDYRDGVRKSFVQIPWKQDMTVLDALKFADEHPRGIELEYSGSGSTALIKRIDDLTNGRSVKPAPEDSGKDPGSDPIKSYWQFAVNGKYAKKSAGVMPLVAGDEVSWWFGKYDRVDSPSDAAP